MGISIRTSINEGGDEEEKKDIFQRDDYCNPIMTLTNLIKCETVYDKSVHANCFTILVHSRNSRDCKEEQMLRRARAMFFSLCIMRRKNK